MKSKVEQEERRALMAVEIEVKLQATRKIMEKIYENPYMFNWKIEKKGMKHLISHYYDTEDLKLLFANLAFRIREEEGKGKKYVTLKANGKSENGLYIRDETQFLLQNGEDVFSAEFLKRHFPKVYEVTKGEFLTEILTIDNQRYILRIDKRNSKIEVCLDFLHFIKGKRKSEYNEIEIELMSGCREDLMECSSLLQTTYGLVPSGASKYEAGLRCFNLIPIP